MRQRVSHISVLAVAFALIVAACAGTTEPSESTTTTAAPGGTTTTESAGATTTAAQQEDVTIQYWYFGEFKDVPGFEDVTTEYGDWEKVVAQAFMDENPNITVETRLLPWSDAGYQTVLAAIAADAPPDVIRDGQLRISQYANLDTLDDLTGTMSAEDSADFGDSLDLFTWDGKVLAYPHFGFASVLLVNKTLFEQANALDLLPAATGRNWTFEQHRAAAEAVTDLSTGTFGVGVPAGGTTGDYFNREYLIGYGAELWNAAGDQVILNSPEGAQGLQYLRDLVEAELVPPGSVSQEYYDAFGLFLQGKIGMYPGSNFSWAEISGGWADAGLDEFDLIGVNFPSVGGADHPVGIAPTGIAVFSQDDSARQEAGRKFAAFVASASNQEIECTTSGQFCLRTSLQDVLGDGPGVADVRDIVENNPKGDIGWKSPFYAVQRPFFFPAMQAAMLGLETPTEALDGYAEEANAAIDRAKE